MQRAEINGTTLEYEERGSGEPVVFIHGALVGDTYRPLMVEPALNGYRVIGYHRRGYSGSSSPQGQLSIADHARDCLGLMRKLEATPAHVIGHSSGAIIAIQLVLDAPEAVRSLSLLEPALLDVHSGPALVETLAASVPTYESGDRAAAVDTFFRGVCGNDYRQVIETTLPGAPEQAVADADSFFSGEFPAIAQWQFSKADAARISQPVLSVLGANTEASIGLPVYTEINQRVLEWFPHAEGFVLPKAAHLLQVENPRDMAERLASFLLAS